VADKPLLKSLSFLMKPIFAANHHWAMRQGEESLQLELARRHAATPQVRALVPAPPPPISPVPFYLGAAAFLLFALFILWPKGRRED